MGILESILTIIYVIICLGIIVLVMIQTTQSSGGLGAMFGGASQTVFGSGSMNVFNKATAILAVIFIILSFILGFLPRFQAVPIKQLGKQIVEEEERKAFEKQKLQELETEKVPIEEPVQEPLIEEKTKQEQKPREDMSKKTEEMDKSVSKKSGEKQNSSKNIENKKLK